MDKSSSDLVLCNPGLFAGLLEAVLRLTDDGLYVWRRAEGDPKRLTAWPSRLIRTPEDYEMRIGRRLAGVTVGFRAETPGTDNELMLRIIDGVGNHYYLEYRDIPAELRRLVKKVHRVAKKRCGKGRLSLLLTRG